MASEVPGSFCLSFSPCLMLFFTVLGLRWFCLSPENVLFLPRAFAHAVPTACNVLFLLYQFYFLERYCSRHTSSSLFSYSAFCLSSYHLIGYAITLWFVYLAWSVPSFLHCKYWGKEHRLIHSFVTVTVGKEQCWHLVEAQDIELKHILLCEAFSTMRVRGTILWIPIALWIQHLNPITTLLFIVSSTTPWWTELYLTHS